ncbi:alpha/beta fold hydrolase [Brumimicrobium mesophilum]|uniref:alpha/beta fold hydrolase n=1 Tax=Brumimicrobium mesophilum TaxID=392717 RepID=UPI000D140447|nr:alpha/beta hydrolase [Brumimicrobium mesophilum]
MKSLFKSEAGKKKIIDLYDEKLESLTIDYHYETVDTKYGKTNVIVTGDATKPPMILVHGSNGSAPIALETCQNLHKKYRLYAVDVLAQPNKSEGTRLNMKDDSYGEWMTEVINHFSFDSVEMAGFSFGGLVILKTLEYDESKVKEVYLSAPAYIANGSQLKALFKFFIPMKRYMKTKKQKYVEKFLDEVFTKKDEFAINQLSLVFLEFEMDFTPVPVIDAKKAKEIKTPITIFAAKDDIIFPGKKMLKRASKIFPSLKHTVLIEDSKHVQNSAQNEMIEEVILK